MRNIKKELEKCKHPNSRKFTALAKRTLRENNRQRSKWAHALKQSLIGEKLCWVKDRLISDTTSYSPDQVEEVISGYLSRFNDELEEIRYRHGFANRKSRQHANREDVINMTIKRETEEFNTCGIEMPDLMNAVQLNVLREWCGDLKYIQNFKLRRFSKKYLAQERQKLQLVIKEKHEQQTVKSTSDMDTII